MLVQYLPSTAVNTAAAAAAASDTIATCNFRDFRAVPALQAADKLLLTKEVISGIARQEGLQVTFLPKPLAGYAGSGCHCHISLWKVGRRLCQMVSVFTNLVLFGIRVQCVRQKEEKGEQQQQQQHSRRQLYML
jgi:hypothetical protein